MAGITIYLSILTVNVNGLNSPIKRHRLAAVRFKRKTLHNAPPSTTIIKRQKKKKLKQSKKK
jgi:hypothetical protein